MKKNLLFFILYIVITPGTYAQSWLPVGSVGFSAGYVNYTTIAIDTGGTPYVVYADGGNDNRATVMKFNGSSWVPVGSPGFSAGPVKYTSIAINGSGTPYVVYTDSAYNNQATVMKYNGTAWVNVGSPGFSAEWAAYTSIAIDQSGTPYVAYTSVDTSGGAYFTGATFIMKFTGGSWMPLGNPLGYSDGTDCTSIAIDGSGVPYVDFGSPSFPGGVAMKYSDTGWVTLGNAGYSVMLVNYSSIAIDTGGTPYVVYTDIVDSQKVTVKKYTGSGWVTVGSEGFTEANATCTAIAIDRNGTPYIVYSPFSGTYGPATVFKFNGSSWDTVGAAGFSGWYAHFTDIAIDPIGTPYVVYSDGTNLGKTTVMKYGFSTEVKNTSEPVSSITLFPNPTHNTFTLKLTTTTNEPATITITNILGEKVKQLIIPTNEDMEIQLDAVPGVYLVTAISKDGNVNGKIILE